MPKNRQLVSSLVKQFKEDYFNERGETPATVSTWKVNYQPVFNRLPQAKVLTEALLRENILSTEANTRSRRNFTLGCSLLADYAGLEHNLRRLIGDYSCKKVNPRNVPNDETIAKIGLQIPNENWRYAYGLMATYGIRNCEVFLLDKTDFPILTVGKSKHGDTRLVYPLFPEWVDLFRLKDGILPNCQGKTNSDLGNRVCKAFERYKIPFTAYNLRHAWARRSLEFGMDITIASEMMGHSVTVHSRIYHAWLSQDVFQNAYDKLIANPDRPKPPSLVVTV